MVEIKTGKVSLEKKCACGHNLVYIGESVNGVRVNIGNGRFAVMASLDSKIDLKKHFENFVTLEKCCTQCKMLTVPQWLDFLKMLDGLNIQYRLQEWEDEHHLKYDISTEPIKRTKKQEEVYRQFKIKWLQDMISKSKIKLEKWEKELADLFSIGDV